MQKALLLLAGIICLSAVVATITIGTRTFEGTVVADPYETGLQWDEKNHAREQSGWRVNVVTEELANGQVPLKVRITDRQGMPLQDARVQIQATRPETGRFDRTYPALPAQGGVYQAAADLPLTGRWDLRIHVSRGMQTAEFSGMVRVTGTK